MHAEAQPASEAACDGRVPASVDTDASVGEGIAPDLEPEAIRRAHESVAVELQAPLHASVESPQAEAGVVQLPIVGRFAGES